VLLLLQEDTTSRNKVVKILVNKKTVVFRLNLPEELNRLVLSYSALTGITKHDFLIEAVKEKLERDKEKLGF
jgi:formate dehydrogenase assembly factor FdhD